MYRYFYFPDRISYGTPADAGHACEDVRFRSADGTTLAGWFIRATAERPLGTVVHMHGNAQNMSAHWPYAEWLLEAGYNVFTFDYRGYGNSPGRPEPRGLFEDAVAALDYVRSRADTARLCVFGQSLGGMLAIAAAAASPQDVCAVLAEAPVHSYSAWAEDQMPEKELVLDDSYCASTHVAALAPIPLLLLHSPGDRVVPYAHSQQLLAAAGEPRQLVTIPDGEHNDAMTERHGTRYQDIAAAFFRQACGQ
ncbi:MAG: alpha/beta hydrolase [Rhodocyclaceae bacterium]|nr:alpha/beta hydrolase [Rhodocyclaceae bacterium]